MERVDEKQRLEGEIIKDWQEMRVILKIGGV